MSTHFRIHYAVPPENQFLIAEVYYGNEHLAELNTESKELLLVLFPRPSGLPWTFSADELLGKLHEAATELKRRSVFFDSE
jgi:hypothetical protein